MTRADFRDYLIEVIGEAAGDPVDAADRIIETLDSNPELVREFDEADGDS